MSDAAPLRMSCVIGTCVMPIRSAASQSDRLCCSILAGLLKSRRCDFVQAKKTGASGFVQTTRRLGRRIAVSMTSCHVLCSIRPIRMAYATQSFVTYAIPLISSSWCSS
jgi:hypothetical protein